MEIPLQQHCSKSSHKSNDVFIFVLGRKLNPKHHFAAMGHKKGKLGQMGQSGSKSKNFHFFSSPICSKNLPEPENKIKFIS